MNGMLDFCVHISFKHTQSTSSHFNVQQQYIRSSWRNPEIPEYRADVISVPGSEVHSKPPIMLRIQYYPATIFYNNL